MTTENAYKADGATISPAGPPPTIQQQVDAALAAKQAENAKRERSGKWSPSQFGYCFRRQFWNRKNEPQSDPPDARSLRVFQAGHLFHDFVQRFFSDGVEQVIEIEDVKGRADIVRADEVVDVKSQHSKAFWWMSKEIKAGKSILDIKRENVLQLGWYAIELGRKFLRLVYVSKDDLCVEEFRVPVADTVRGMVNQELADLRAIWSNGTLPPALPRAYGSTMKKKSECRYCPWNTKCWAMEGWDKKDEKVEE